MKIMRSVSWKKFFVLVALAAVATGLFQGEWIFNQILRSYLALNGVHARTLEKGGARIFYFEGGDEHPRSVILLHGVGGNSLSSWFQLLPELVDKYHVIAPDLFFANLADLVDSGYHVRSEEVLVEMVMDAAKVDTAALVGLSFGAWPALQLAMDRPDRVEKLVLVSPLDGSANAILDDLDLDDDNLGKDFYSRIFEIPPPVPNIFLWNHWDRATKVFKALPFFRQQLDVEGRLIDQGLRKVQCPSLVIHGDRDRIIPVERFRSLAAGMSDGRVLSLETCGHAVVWDQPGQLANAIEAFLGKKGK